MDDLIEIAKRVFDIEARAISALKQRVDRRFLEAVEIIFNSKGRVVVTGMGKSGIIAKKVAATLASTGTPAFFMHPAEAGHGDLGMVTPDDVMIAISNSGETDELVSLIPFLKRFNVKLISMTGNPDSILARSSDVGLDISVEEEACPMGIVPTASTAAALAMGDAIAVALLKKRGLREEDFALFHPGGSLGKRLLIRVKDLMHTGDEVPIVHPHTPMTDAVMEISSKRLGVTIVADADRKIVGIITDGDLRRGIQRWGKGFFEMKAEEVMTRNPKMVSGDELAAKAVSIMESYSITSLIVPDETGRVSGIIHLHDILKRGIV
jgi:arabinose-5-phosphate isomerase